MKGFNCSTKALRLIESYPLPDHVWELVHERLDNLNDSFVRLWLHEGIPYAFKEAPFLYQMSREWLARRLEISPQQVSMVGSGRIGYSLKPSPNFRRAFNPSSDLDYVLISQPLFDKCAEVSLQFAEDFENRITVPDTSGEKRWWPEDVEYIRNNVPKGFVNGGKVPNIEKYEFMRRIEHDFWVLGEKLKQSLGCPIFKKATFRVYKDHSAFVSQASLNLKNALLRSI